MFDILKTRNITQVDIMNEITIFVTIPSEKEKQLISYVEWLWKLEKSSRYEKPQRFEVDEMLADIIDVTIDSGITQSTALIKHVSIVSGHGMTRIRAVLKSYLGVRFDYVKGVGAEKLYKKMPG